MQHWKIGKLFVPCFFFGWVAQGVASVRFFVWGIQRLCPYMTLYPKYTTIFKSSVQVCNCLQIQCPSTQLSPKVVCHYATVTKFRVHLRNCHQNMGTFWPLGSPREPPRPSRTEVRKRVDFGPFFWSILGVILEPFFHFEPPLGHVGAKARSRWGQS